MNTRARGQPWRDNGGGAGRREREREREDASLEYLVGEGDGTEGGNGRKRTDFFSPNLP